MKLAQEPCYHDIITPEQFQLCGLVINVSLHCGCLTSVFVLLFVSRLNNSQLITSSDYDLGERSVGGSNFVNVPLSCMIDLNFCL